MAQINGSTAQLPSHFSYYIIWEETDVNVANNTSVVTAYVYVQKVGSYNVQSANNNHYLYIDGTGFNANNYVDMNPETTPRLLVSGSKTITHNADGSKSITISASGDICKISGATYSPQSGSGSATVSLTTIPRRATITGSANLTIGNNHPYTLNNSGGLYVKLVMYVFNGTTYDTVITSNRGTGSSGTLELGTTENNILYSAMPNATSTYYTLRAYTYSDAGYTTQVGDYHDVAGFVYVNQTTNKPTFTDYAVANVDKSIEVVDKYSNSLVTSSTSTLLGSDTKMIKGYSKLQATISTANKMVALNYATNVKYRFVAGTKQTEANYSADSTVTIDIDNATTKDVSVLAIDSRSLSTSVAKSLSYLADYTPISIWGLTLVRDNGVDDGTKLQISGKLWKEYFGGGTSGVLNTVTAHYRFKETTESWSAQTWTAITLTDDGSGNLSYDDYINGDLGASGFDPEKSYSIEVRVFDKLSQMIVEETLSVGTPVMHIVKEGISLGARYDSDEGGSIQILGKNSLITGWYPAIETWTYDAVNRFKISGDYTGIYQVGDKIKLTQTTVKYFRITAISYSSPNTTVTVEAFNLYALADATITDRYFSRIETPLGFPAREKVLYNGSDSASITLSESSAYFSRLLVFYHQDTRKYVEMVDVAGSGAPMTTMSYLGYFDSAYRIRIGSSQIIVSGTSVYFYGVGGSYSTDTTSSSAVGFSDVKIIPTIYKVIGIRY